MVKLVICDFDDTLVCERKFVESGFSACAANLEKYGIEKPRAKKVFWSEFEKSHEGVFNRSVEKIFGKPDETLSAELVEVYRLHKPDISYEADVPQFFAGIRARKLDTAIVTDGNSETQHHKLDAVGAENDFDKIIVTSDFGPDFKKPSIKSFAMLGKIFDTDYREMLYIGDNPHKDFAMSAEIPISTVRIKRKGMIHDYPDYRNGIMEDFRIESLAEIFALPPFAKR